MSRADRRTGWLSQSRPMDVPERPDEKDQQSRSSRTARSLSRLLTCAAVGAAIVAPASALGMEPHAGVCPAGDGGSPGFSYLPDAASSQVRFLTQNVNLASLGGETASYAITVPADQSSFELGVFDGDMGGAFDLVSGTGELATYTLIADPRADGTGTMVVGQWTSAAMPDAAWFAASIPTTTSAATPSGNFSYRLRVTTSIASGSGLNNFKLRARGALSIRARSVWSFIGFLNFSDPTNAYPSWPSLTPTTYDGSWSLFLDVPPAQTSLEVWDGDADFGVTAGTPADTDDPNSSGVPSWSSAAAVAEGVNAANPPDDAASPIFARPPSVVYDLIAPNGVSYHNPNPSGTAEWERFRLDTTTSDPVVADHRAASIPKGVWEMKLTGLDLTNTVAVRTDQPVLGVCDDGSPVRPPGSLALGDRIWLDADGDGIQDAGEVGIAGVVVSLRDETGAVVATTTTGALGNYRFVVAPGSWRVQVDTANFSSGGPLAGLLPSGATSATRTLATTNDFTFDFGFHPLAALGDRVWHDRDRDGVQERGEPGIGGVTVVLRRDGVEIRRATTDKKGRYLFEDLEPGAGYSIRVLRPRGYRFTRSNRAKSERRDSDVHPRAGQSGSIALGVGQTNRNLDAGLWLPTRITVRKLGPSRAQAGGLVTYRLEVRNRGRAAAYGVTLTDALPRRLSLRWSAAKGLRAASNRPFQLRSGRVIWRLGTLKAGSRRIVRLRTRVAATASGRVTNRARANARNASLVRARRTTRISRRVTTVSPAVTG